MFFSLLFLDISVSHHILFLFLPLICINASSSASGSFPSFCLAALWMHTLSLVIFHFSEDSVALKPFFVASRNKKYVYFLLLDATIARGVALTGFAPSASLGSVVVVLTFVFTSYIFQHVF